MNSKRLKNILITNSFTYDDHFEQDAISKQVGKKWKFSLWAGCNKSEQAGKKIEKFPCEHACVIGTPEYTRKQQQFDSLFECQTFCR